MGPVCAGSASLTVPVSAGGDLSLLAAIAARSFVGTAEAVTRL